MSELTRCNYCTLSDMKREAAKNGKVVTLVPNPDNGGSNAYIHDPDVNIMDPEIRKEYTWGIWFMEVGESCSC